MHGVCLCLLLLVQRLYFMNDSLIVKVEYVLTKYGLHEVLC